MYVARIDKFDITNNPGDSKPALTIWFAGCSIRCKDCHNKQLWDKSNGASMSVDDIVAFIQAIDYQYNTVLLLGGEPMDQDHSELEELIVKVSSLDKSVMMYTAFEIDNIQDEILMNLDTVKCGKYEESLKTGGFPASSNQKIYQNSPNGFIDITEIFKGESYADKHAVG